MESSSSLGLPLKVMPMYLNYKEDFKLRRDPPAVKGNSSTTKELPEDMYANSAFINQCKVKTKHSSRHPPNDMNGYIIKTERKRRL